MPFSTTKRGGGRTSNDGQTGDERRKENVAFSNLTANISHKANYYTFFVIRINGRGFSEDRDEHVSTTWPLFSWELVLKFLADFDIDPYRPPLIKQKNVYTSPSGCEF